MKRLIQPVAAVIIGVVAMQPGLAGLVCAAPAAPCPMVISDMGPNCGAVSKADLNGSRPVTQVRAIPRSIASVALPATRKALALVTPPAQAETLPLPAAVALVDSQTAAQANSPPIYIRNRVFRI